ncbi:MAG TPA: FMN-binding protein [Amnibacterium sp.]|jgi:uncharacterized protein with FMN-binding domain|nr:FMN-binding protein [Amnibacterium sp.]
MRVAAVMGAVTGSAVALLAGFAMAAAGAASSTAPLPLPPPEGDGTATSAEHLGVIEGPRVETKYGPIRVAIGVRGRRLVRVWVLAVPNRYGRSVRASTTALPVLERRSLDQGSADVDAVSGATYTSEGYRRSLQAALDRLD